MDDEQKMVSREEPTVDQPRSALVTDWCDRVRRARDQHWDKDFKRIRSNVAFARTGAQDGMDPDNDYVVNLIQRHVNFRVAQLYAKNPKAVARRTKRMEYRIWDGKAETIAMAQELMAPPVMDPMTGIVPPPPDPTVMMQAQMLLLDYQEGMSRKKMYDRLSKTLEILFENALHEQEPTAKIQFKQLVRRVVTSGIGYAKIGFRRLYEPDPEVEAQIGDITDIIARIQRISTNIADGEIDMDAPEVENLRLMVEDLTAKKDVLATEGIIFAFPRATEIIVDPKVRHLKGFIGADWIAHEMMLTPDQVQEVWGVDVSASAKRHEPVDAKKRPEGKDGQEETYSLCTVWEIQSKRDGMIFTVCDGHADFLEEPRAPLLKLKRFWNVFTLIFNDVESEGGDKPTSVYPPSDVELLRPMQEEFNRAGQGLREHRIANRPKYVSGAGALEDGEMDNLEGSPAHSIIRIQSLQPGQDPRTLLAPIEHAAIDGSLYDKSPILSDIQLATGSQEANLGGAGDEKTATESSIQETSRVSTVASNVEDIDDFLSEVAGAMGHIMLSEYSPETVMRIAGPGAIWPEFAAQDVADDIFLEIEAGSSGKPNKALELANLERATPLLIQVPGVSPSWLARKTLALLGDGIDLDEAIVEGMPSIVAMNAMSGQAPAAPAGQGGGNGDPQSDPAAQGGQGAQNGPTGPSAAPQSQPAFPAPGQMGM